MFLGKGRTPRPRGAAREAAGAAHVTSGCPWLAGRLPGRASRRQGGQAARARCGKDRRGEEAGCATQALRSSSILGSAELLAARHPLSAAGAAPGALIGSQRPGARVDRLTRAGAPQPLGERPSGRRPGGGEPAGKERKGKGRGGGALGEGRGRWWGQEGRDGKEAGCVRRGDFLQGSTRPTRAAARHGGASPQP